MKNFDNCCVNPCCATRPSCCNPCCPCPPSAPENILVAAGTGVDPFEFLNLTLNIPFANNLYEQGNAVRHTANSPDFVILETGQYRIDYQLSVYDPVLLDLDIMEISVSLVSNLSGVLDTIDFTVPLQLAQRSVTVNLSVAETLVLQASQPYLSEMRVNSQAIVITKLS